MTVRAHRVNGELISQHIGDKIILLGSIINGSTQTNCERFIITINMPRQVSANGTNLEMKTSDSMVINVILSNPFDGNATGYAEVHGIVKSKTTVACTNLIQFPPELTSKFEMDQYNDLIVMSKTLGPIKWKMSRSNAIAQTVKS